MIASTLRCLWAHLCSLFVLSCTTTCISCLKLCLAVHTQKCQQQAGRVLLNVWMAVAIGRRCVQIFGSIPKRLTMGQKWYSRAETPRWCPAQGFYGRTGGSPMLNPIHRKCVVQNGKSHKAAHESTTNCLFAQE